MNKLKAVLRLADQGLSQRQIAASCVLGPATVSDYLARARAADLRYQDIAHWPGLRLLAAVGITGPREHWSGFGRVPCGWWELCHSR